MKKWMTVLSIAAAASVLQLAALPSQAASPAVPDAPSLVVGIVVDQMRPDLVYRYWDKLGDDGLRRLIKGGFTFTHMHFDYMPTSTGPGHAGVFTGTTPSVHGIMGNGWFVRDLGRSINVIDVPGHQGVGARPGGENNKGPSNLLTTTLGDELRLHTNMRSRVIGISRKDRAAMMMTGHLGDAYWYEGATGNFVTSSFYRESLPQWLDNFNSQDIAQTYLAQVWDTLLPIETYTESISDANAWENIYADQTEPVFPHDLPTRVREHGAGPGLLSSTPFADQLLTDFAIAAIDGEQLGQRGVTDLLAIGYSAIDSIGHAYGPASVETQDAYLRLDRYLAALLNHLDNTLGEDEYLVFLTSDHGVVHVPGYLEELGIPGGYYDAVAGYSGLGSHLQDTYGADLLQGFSNFDIFLDREQITALGLDLGQVQQQAARYMLGVQGVAGALTAETLTNNQFDRDIRAIVQNGFHQQRSGDLMVWLSPQMLPQRSSGSDHGSPWSYDRHAPMYWYGKNIPVGESAAAVFIRDIASTVATFLRSPLPSGNTGNPMNEHMRRP
jgi:hypothetical protein